MIYVEQEWPMKPTLQVIASLQYITFTAFSLQKDTTQAVEESHFFTQLSFN